MDHTASEVSLDKFDDLIPIADIVNSSGTLSREEIPTIHNHDNSMEFTPKIERRETPPQDDFTLSKLYLTKPECHRYINTDEDEDAPNSFDKIKVISVVNPSPQKVSEQSEFRKLPSIHSSPNDSFITH